MTRPSLAGIEQRAAAATEGPWVSADCTDEESDWYDDDDGPMVVTQDSTPGIYTAICKDFWEEGAGPANARFVADARTAVPALLDAVRDVLAILAGREAEMGDLALPDLRALIRDVRAALATRLDLTDPEGDPT